MRLAILPADQIHDQKKNDYTLTAQTCLDCQSFQKIT